MEPAGQEPPAASTAYDNDAAAVSDAADAAARVQAVMRGHASRRELQRRRSELVAAAGVQQAQRAASVLLQRMMRGRRARKQKNRRALAAVTMTKWARKALSIRHARQWRQAEMRAQAEAAARLQKRYRASVGMNLPGYAGERKAGKPHGKGRMVEDDGSWYEGEWVHGVRHGQGKRMWPDGSMYDGQFEDGEPHGAGSHVEADGGVRRYGAWQRGTLHGEGALVVPASGGPGC